MRKSIVVALGLIGLMASMPAHAATFIFGFGNGYDTASGVLTTTDSATDPLTITGITGTFDGNAITSLIAPGGYAANDNLLNRSAPYLNVNGFSFVANGINQNIYYSAPEYYTLNGIQPATAGTFSLREVAAVPEPATWAMMLTGFLGIGGAIRYRKRKQPKVRFAF